MTIHKMSHAKTVRQLIEYLENLDQDAYVILSRDSEGNGFSPLSTPHGEGLYIADSTWSGEWVDPEQEEDFDPEDHDMENAHKAIFLFPVN